MTEGITGVNLPASQLLIGCGVPLPRIPFIRALYGQEPRGTQHFDVETTAQVWYRYRDACQPLSFWSPTHIGRTTMQCALVSYMALCLPWSHADGIA